MILLYLSVLDKLGKIFLADAILGLDVEQDYSEIEKNRWKASRKLTASFEKVQSSLQDGRPHHHVRTFLHASTWGPHTFFNQVTQVSNPSE